MSLFPIGYMAEKIVEIFLLDYMKRTTIVLIYMIYNLVSFGLTSSSQELLSRIKLVGSLTTYFGSSYFAPVKAI